MDNKVTVTSIFFGNLVIFILFFTNFVPISLLVTLELVTYIQVRLININIRENLFHGMSNYSIKNLIKA